MTGPLCGMHLIPALQTYNIRRTLVYCQLLDSDFDVAITLNPGIKPSLMFYFICQGHLRQEPGLDSTNLTFMLATHTSLLDP